jgi:cellulose synthase/poly-beta-1,6-N-acetylglucosamine synthase-like glycosyltransferase
MELNSIIGMLLTAAVLYYSMAHLGLFAGLRRCDQSRYQHQPFVSIIVAARNEENTIRQLLESLLRQSYPHKEIIIINDRSTDKTAALIADFQKSFPGIKQIDITDVPKDMPAKKNALRAGIVASKGEILCFTDADCFPPSTWIEELVLQFAPGVGLVAGYSPYQSFSKTGGFLSKVFYNFISYEEFRAGIWSAGAIGCNLGWLCTGRNLAYRRIVYDEVGGFEKIKQSISGDDDLFLQLVRKKTDWKIRYLLSVTSYVPTFAPPKFWSFVDQRKRHFSAAKYFTVPMMSFFFFYHSANLLLFFSPVFFCLNLISVNLLVVCICAKLTADAVLILSSAQRFGRVLKLQSFIVMEALYVFYNALIGPLGLFKKFEWKQQI